MLGALVWICCLTVVAAQRGGGNFLPSQVLAGGGGGPPTTTPIPILKDSRRIDLQTGAFVYEYIGGDGSSKFEFRYPNGTVVGNYSFVNENGELETRVYNHGAEVDETTDPNYVDLGNYELYRHLERPYVHNEGDLGPAEPLQFAPQAARPQAPPRRRQRQRRPRPTQPQIQIQPQFQPVPQPKPQPPPQPQFRPQPQVQPQPQFRPQPQPQFRPQPQFQPQPQPQPQFQPQPQVQPQPQFRPQPPPQPQFRPQPQARRPPPPPLPAPQAPRPSLIDTPIFQIPAPTPARQQFQQRQHRLDLSQQPANNRNSPDAFLDSVIARFNN